MPVRQRDASSRCGISLRRNEKPVQTSKTLCGLRLVLTKEFRRCPRISRPRSVPTQCSHQNLWHFPRADPVVRRWQTTHRSKDILLTASRKSPRQLTHYSKTQTCYSII